MLWCKVCPLISEKKPNFQNGKKAGKIGQIKHGHNFAIFSQPTGQTWYHTSAYHLSALELQKRNPSTSGVFEGDKDQIKEKGKQRRYKEFIL